MAYSINEVIDIAIGLEQTGLEFYTKCSEKFEEDELKDVFLFLAREEKVHKETFESLKDKQQPVDGVFTDDYFLYLKSIGGSRVFAEKKQSIEKIMDSIDTPEDAIKKAFMDEKESILFYSELKNLYPNSVETLKLLNNIIEEERKHVLTLSDLLQKINMAR